MTGEADDRTCPHCGGAVLLSVRARFCSGKCRDKYHSRRNRALRESAVRLSVWAEQRSPPKPGALKAQAPMADDRAALYLHALRDIVAALSSDAHDAAQTALEIAADAIANEDADPCKSLGRTSETPLTQS